MRIVSVVRSSGRDAEIAVLRNWSLRLGTVVWVRIQGQLVVTGALGYGRDDKIIVHGAEVGRSQDQSENGKARERRPGGSVCSHGSSAESR